MANLEREYIVPLRKEWLKSVRFKRAKKAARALKEFLAKHMKTDEENVKLSRWVNEELWERGIKNPPAKIKVKVSKDDKGIVHAELADLSERAKKIIAKDNERSEKLKSKKETEKKKEDEKKEVEKKADETVNEEEKSKAEEKKEEEKIMHEMDKPEEPKSTQPVHEHQAKKTKPFRTALKK